MIMPGVNPLFGLAANKPDIAQTPQLRDDAQASSTPPSTQAPSQENATPNPEIEQAAQDFEAVFIGQMLKHSGFGEALTKSGGEAVAAFSDFYIENIAGDMAAKGGFGLAEHFYESLLSKTESSAL